MRNKAVLPALAAIVFLLVAAPALRVPGLETVWPERLCYAGAAEKEIRVLSKVTVNRKQVYLSDICERENVPAQWKELMAKTYIGDAPSAGSEKFIDPAQLRAYLAHLLESNGPALDGGSDIRFEVPERVVIARESVQVTQEQIESIFRKFVMDNSPWKQQDITIQKVHFSGIPVIPAGDMTYEVTSSQARDRFIGNVNASIDFLVDGEKVRTLAVAGKVEVYQDVYHASRPLKQNGVIEQADLEVQRVNISDAPDRFATRPDQVVGRRLLRNVGTHRALDLKDLDKPFLLRKGDPVTIVFDQPGIIVTARGQVTADGGLGDTVPVVNVSSKKTVYCRVVDTQTVRAAQ